MATRDFIPGHVPLASPRKKAYDPKNDTSVLLEKKKVETRPVEVETLES